VIFAINCGIVATIRRPFAVSRRLVALQGHLFAQGGT
jgi:hypothetical protein